MSSSSSADKERISQNCAKDRSSSSSVIMQNSFPMECWNSAQLTIARKCREVSSLEGNSDRWSWHRSSQSSHFLNISSETWSLKEPVGAFSPARAGLAFAHLSRYRMTSLVLILTGSVPFFDLSSSSRTVCQPSLLALHLSVGSEHRLRHLHPTSSLH